MFNIVVDVVIGLVFIYLLYSLLATSLQEAMATILHRRANTLYKGIRSMLTNKSRNQGLLIGSIVFYWDELAGRFLRIRQNILVQLGKWNLTKTKTEKLENRLYVKFYNHPIIKNYGQNTLFKKPSYLTAGNFSDILIETLKNLDENNKQVTATFPMVQKAVKDNETMIGKDTFEILTYHMNEAAGDLGVLKQRLAKWYDDTMDRVSGWYKRNTQFWLFAIGIILAITLNIDSIEISNYLSDNKTARNHLAQMGIAAASNADKSGNDSITKEVLDSIKADMVKVNTLVGLGWGDYGSSDSAFRKYYLSDSICKKDTTKAYKAYLFNYKAAQTLFDTSKAQAIRDSIIKKGTKDSVRVTRLLDSLRKHETRIIAQQQFAMLYGTDEFDDSLKVNYVLCYRLWYPRKWLGFLLTAFAIGLGAPFWFDLLNKFVSLRSAVKSVNSSGSTTKNNNSNTNSETQSSS